MESREKGKTPSLLRGAVALAIACAATVLFYRTPLLEGEVFYLRDIARYILPIATLVQTRILAGEIPLWNPHVFGGLPLLGDLTSGVLYPPFLVSLLLEPARAITLLIAGHHLLAVLGMYLFLRRHGAGTAAALAAGTGFSFSGYLVAMDNSLIYMTALCWTPWVLWAADRLIEKRSRGPFLLLALLVAAQVLSGEVQWAYQMILLSLAYTLFASKEPLKGLVPVGGALLLALALSSIQLVPFLSVAMGTARWEGLSTEAAQLWSFHPLRLAEFLLPYPQGAVPAGQSFWGHALVNHPNRVPWAHGVYLGAPLVLLSLFGCSLKRRLGFFLWGCALLGVGLALGANAPLHSWLRELLPLWGSFRYPEKLLALSTFALAAAAGLGLQALLEPGQGDGKRTGPRLPFSTALLFLLAAGGLWISMGAAEDFWNSFVDRMLREGEVRHVAAEEALGMLALSFRWATAAAAAALLLVSLQRLRILPRFLLAWLWFALVAADTMSVNARLVSTTRDSFYAEPVPALGRISERADEQAPYRVYRGRLNFRAPPGTPPEELTAAHVQWLRQTLAPNSGMELGFHHTAGYSEAASLSFERFWRALAGGGGERLLTLAGVRFVVDSDSSPIFADRGEYGMLFRESGADLRLLELKDPAPRARVVYRWRNASSDEEALAALAARDFNPRQEAVLLNVEGGGRENGPPAGVAPFLRYSPEEVIVEAEALQEGYLVLGDAYDGEWQAEVDGERATIVKANFMQRAVALPTGAHRVRFFYRPLRLRAGAAVSAAALLLALFLPVGTRTRKMQLHGHGRTKG